MQRRVFNRPEVFRGSTVPDRDELRDNADPDLLRADRTEGHSNRRVNAIESWQAPPSMNPLQDSKNLAAATDHPEVTMVEPGIVVERLLVESMVMGNDEEPIFSGDAEPLGSVAWLRQQALAAWEALFCIQLFAIIHDDHAKTDRSRHHGGGARDVPSAKDNEPRLALDPLHKDLHPTPAAHPQIPSQIVTQDHRLAIA